MAVTPPQKCLKEILRALKKYPKIHLNERRPQPIVDVWIGQVAHNVCPPVDIFLKFCE